MGHVCARQRYRYLLLLLGGRRVRFAAQQPRLSVCARVSLGPPALVSRLCCRCLLGHSLAQALRSQQLSPGLGLEGLGLEVFTPITEK